MKIILKKQIWKKVYAINIVYVTHMTLHDSQKDLLFNKKCKLGIHKSVLG